MNRKSWIGLLLISIVILTAAGCAGFEAKAAAKGDLSVVRAYLDSGGGVDDPQKGGCTLLMYAAKGGQTGILDYLLNEGASLSARDDKGRSALMYAAAAGERDAAEVLLDAGAYINSTDLKGRTALMAAAEKDHSTLVELLLSAKADFKAEDKNAWTALLLALDDNVDFSSGINRSVTLLTEAGAVFDGKSDKIINIATRAAERGNRVLLAYLYSRGLDKGLRIHSRFSFQFSFFL